VEGIASRTPRGRALFREGSATIGVGVSHVLSPSLFSILAEGGADYGLVDMEHTSFSYRDVATLIASARAAEIPIVVRPPEVSRSAIGRLLDLGADGILAPRAEGKSGRGAAALVRFGKYRPLGDRGDDGRIARAFPHGDPRALTEELNSSTVLIASVETKDDVESIDEICSTAGIDAIWVGPADLSLALDAPGDLDNTAYKAAEERILDSCRSHGMRFAIGTASTPAAALEQIELGCFTVFIDDEAGLLRNTISAYVTRVRDLLDQASTA
jgi:4-hydroxy-2-oxoheptanedioate aldolase